MSSSHTGGGPPPPGSTHSFWHSQPSPLLTGHRSTRDLPGQADVVIIGSGITGTSAAWHLLNPDLENASTPQTPLNVVMLEAREACWGATGRNGGHCQPILFEHPNDPTIGDFELKNFEEIRSTIDEFQIPCEFVVQPGCRAIYSEYHLEATKKALDILKTAAPHQHKRMTLVTDTQRLAELRIPTAKAAVVTDIAARLWPYKFVAFLLEKLVTSHNLHNNSTFNLQTLTPANSLSPSPSGDWTITTPRGTINTKKVILATNAYTPHLLPSLKDLIVPCRGQMSALLPPPSLTTSSRLTTSLGFLGDGMDDYLIQRPNESGGHLMFGGGRHEGEHCIGTIDDNVIDAVSGKYLRTRLIEALGLQGAGVGELEAVGMWTGIMGFSRDEHPWVGEVEGGVFVAAGYTGHGMPNTWLCGKAVGMMVAGVGVEGVREGTGLPECYLVSERRMKRAREMESVEARDAVERERGGK